MGDNHGKPGFPCSTACKVTCFIKINVIHSSGSIQRGERIMFEQRRTPSTSSISSGKWSFASNPLHLRSLSIARCYWVDLFTYKMSSTILAFTAHRVPHPKGTTLSAPRSSLPVSVAFPTSNSVMPRSCRQLAHTQPCTGEQSIAGARSCL